jgi:hypothetical protein
MGCLGETNDLVLHCFCITQLERRMRLLLFVSAALIALHGVAWSEWSVETVREDGTGRQTTRALLPEPGGRATLVIQCSQHEPEPVLYLHEPASGSQLQLIYRFDDDAAQPRTAPLSPSGHVVRIWSELERHAFANARRLRVQLRPFVVFDFDLRGIETIASRLKC